MMRLKRRITSRRMKAVLRKSIELWDEFKPGLAD
jgi:hypothetical protein